MLTESLHYTSLPFILNGKSQIWVVGDGQFCYVENITLLWGSEILMTFPQETQLMHQWRVTYFHGYKCCEMLLPSNSNHPWYRKREESGFTRINSPIFGLLQNAGAQAALQAAQQLMCASGGVGGMDEPKTVLRVIIEHMLYPVTIDVLKQVRFTRQIKLTNVCPN